jgi:hypothetical protein
MPEWKRTINKRMAFENLTSQYNGRTPANLHRKTITAVHQSILEPLHGYLIVAMVYTEYTWL